MVKKRGKNVEVLPETHQVRKRITTALAFSYKLVYLFTPSNVLEAIGEGLLMAVCVGDQTFGRSSQSGSKGSQLVVHAHGRRPYANHVIRAQAQEGQTSVRKTAMGSSINHWADTTLWEWLSAL